MFFLNSHEIQAGWRKLCKVGKHWGSEAWNQNMLQCIFSVSVIRCKYRKVYIIIGLHSGSQKLQVDD